MLNCLFLNLSFLQIADLAQIYSFLNHFVQILTFDYSSANPYCTYSIGVGAALALGAGASLLSGGMSAASQVGANRTNMQMNRESIAAQKAMQLEAQRYNTSERLAAQAYNLPSAQRARYEAAGINPYLAMSQMDSGNTSAQTMSSNSVPSMIPAQGVDYSFIGDSVRNGFDINSAKLSQENMALQNQDKANEISYNSSNRVLSLIEQRARISNSKMDFKTKQRMLDFLDEQIREKSMNNDFFEQTWNERTRSLHSSVMLQDAQVAHQRLLNTFQEIVNSWQGKLNKAQVSKAYAEISNLNIDGALKSMQKAGIQIDNFQKNKINWLARENLRLTNISLGKTIRQQGQDYWNPFKYANLSGSASVGFKKW